MIEYFQFKPVFSSLDLWFYSNCFDFLVLICDNVVINKLHVMIYKLNV